MMHNRIIYDQLRKLIMKFALFVGVCFVFGALGAPSVITKGLEDNNDVLLPDYGTKLLEEKDLNNLKDATSSGSLNVGESNTENRNKIIGIAVGVSVGVLLIGVFLVVAIIIILWTTKCCSKCGRTARQHRYHGEAMLSNEVHSRIKQADIEKSNAELATNYFLETLKATKQVDYGKPTPLHDIGSRLQKYWYNSVPSQRESPEAHGTSLVMLSNTPLSRHCPLLDDHDDETGLTNETIFTLNNLMKKLRQNPFIHPVREIGCLNDRKQVIIIQPFVISGSLKDLIYKVPPNLDWAQKYPNSSPNTTDADYLKPKTNQNKLLCCYKRPDHSQMNPEESQDDELASLLNGQVCPQPSGNDKVTPKLSSPQPIAALAIADVAKYGWQVLKAMMFLYKQGFPVLGHVQSGNIFVQDGVCRLGGYENTLFGYRSRFYRVFQDHLDHMDVIMFGHLLFEMCCGYELTTLVPTDRDYQAVRDVEGGEKVEEELIFIFSHFEEGYATVMPSNMEMIKRIKNHQFFRSGKGSATDKPEGIGHKVLKGLRKQVPAAVGGDKVILSSDEKALLKRVHQGAIQPLLPEIQECQDLSQSGGPHDE